MTYEGLKHMHATALTTALGIQPIDALLAATDRILFGGPAHEIAGRLIDGNRLVMAALKYAYAAYYFLPGLVMGYFYFFGDARKFFLARRAVVLCLYGGYLMYVFLPATGPQFDASRLGQVSAGELHAYAYAMEHLRYQFDCFPSLHTALPWTLTIISWPWLPRPIGYALALCASGSTIATVGLGFHYGIDVLGGLVWCAIVVWLARWTMRVANGD